MDTREKKFYIHDNTDKTPIGKPVALNKDKPEGAGDTEAVFLYPTPIKLLCLLFMTRSGRSFPTMYR